MDSASTGPTPTRRPTPPRGDLLLRAPDHLGDGVMALPAVEALGRAFRVQVEGPPWAGALYARHLRPWEGRAPQVAVLLKPSFSAAWRARRVPRRIGLATDARWPLLTVAVAPSGRHRVEDLRRVARAAGVEAPGLPRFAPAAEDAEAAPPAGEDEVLLLPLAATGAPVRWPGFRALADRLAERGLRPLFTAGPGEDEALARIAGPHPVVPALPVGAFAALAARVRAVVGNDSGLAHLAAAARRGAGRAVSDVHVVFGSTDPARTGPPGATAHRVAAPPPCWPCARKRCPFGVPCLDVDPDRVAAALAG